jgi:hypothetical protein
MSKKQLINLAEFEAMTEDQRNTLGASDLARLTEQQRLAEQDKEDQAQAEAMKTKYAKVAPNGVFCLRVDDAVGWLKNMDRQLVSMVATTAGSDPVEAAELILANCWLEGDERLKHDDEYFLEAITLLQQLRTSKIGQIKKY